MNRAPHSHSLSLRTETLPARTGRRQQVLCLCRHMLTRPLHVGFILSGITIAILCQRNDAQLGWAQFRYVTCGLLIPILCLLASPSFRSVATITALDALRIRYGKNRRHLAFRRLFEAISIAFALGCSSLLIGRLITVPFGRAAFDHNLVIDLGVIAVTTTTYTVLLNALASLGVGQHGSAIALGIDLTLGHGRTVFSNLVPHRHVVEMLDAHGIFRGVPLPSAWVLLGMSCAAALWIAARTRL